MIVRSPLASIQLDGIAGADAYASAYGEGCAEFYDEIYAAPSRAAIEMLASLAGDGPVLEAGVGTGRYALALAVRGIAVHGIDTSPAMLAVLRSKSGAASVTTTLGDFSTTPVSGAFRLIACLTNTLSLLPDAARQAQAIVQFAAALHDDGTVLVESTHAPGEMRRVWTDIPLETRRGTRRYRVACCEFDGESLDAWAANAGLRRCARWRDWRGTPWRGEPGPMLSLYRKNP